MVTRAGLPCGRVETVEDHGRRPLDGRPRRADPGHGLRSTTGPARHVAERVVTGVQSEGTAHDIGGGLGLQLGQRPVGMLFVQQGVRQLVGQGLDLLGRPVAGLDPDATEGVGAVTVGAAGKFRVFDHVAEQRSLSAERLEARARIVSVEVAADHREVLAIRLGEVEHGHGAEAEDRTVFVAVIRASTPPDHGGEDPDSTLPPAHRASHLLPRGESGDTRGPGGLCGDEERIVEAVPVEPALDLEVGAPAIGVGQLAYPVGEGVEQVVTVDGHGRLLRSPGATGPGGRPLAGGSGRSE